MAIKKVAAQRLIYREVYAQRGSMRKADSRARGNFLPAALKATVRNGWMPVRKRHTTTINKSSGIWSGLRCSSRLTGRVATGSGAVHLRGRSAGEAECARFTRGHEGVIDGPVGPN